MAEKLTLTTPVSFTSITEWRLATVFLDVDTPSLKVEFKSNTGERKQWRYIVSTEAPVVTLTQVKNALSFVNKGRFKTVDGVSLQNWLVKQAQTAGVLDAGTIGGTED